MDGIQKTKKKERSVWKKELNDEQVRELQAQAVLIKDLMEEY